MTLQTRTTFGGDCRARALALWPGLDRDKLRRTNGEPGRVARLIERRTSLPPEAILRLLTGQDPGVVVGTTARSVEGVDDSGARVRPPIVVAMTHRGAAR